ncbi:MAG: alpha/beta hydrolase [Candidatus Kariarchaeaceae archaeon]|jgi:pimeloyl-ACP methyl ester carboxylesterase
MHTVEFVLIPGFGGSDRPYNLYRENFPNSEILNFKDAITLDDHLTIIEGILNEKSSKVVLIGVSWGSILALYAAELFPTKVDALILVGSGRKLKMPKSLEGIMKFPFYGFTLLVYMFIASYPFYRIFDRRGYKQKYGGLGILQRLGWKHTHKVFNKTLLNTRFAGKLHHDTLFLNLTSDFLVDVNEIQNLIDSRDDEIDVQSKLFDLTDQHHIHFTHELDYLIIDKALKFLNNRNKIKITEIKKYAH